MLRAADQSGQPKLLRWLLPLLLMAASTVTWYVTTGGTDSAALGPHSRGISRSVDGLMPARRDASGGSRSSGSAWAVGGTNAAMTRRSTGSATYFSIPGLPASLTPPPTVTQPGETSAFLPTTTTPSAPLPAPTPATPVPQTFLVTPPPPPSLMPDGVPASEVGALELNLAGTSLLSSFTQGANAGYDCSPGTNGSYTAGPDGVGLTTSGVLANCAELMSPQTYTYGVFESRIDLPAGPNGRIANWPALWLVGADWPSGGEFDVMEGLGGEQAVHFHYSGGVASKSEPDVLPGWHTFTGVWGPSYTAVYIDGAQVWSWTSSRVTSVPMQVLFDMTTGISGYSTSQPSTMWVSYLRIWHWQ